MRKITYLKSILLLCALIVGVGNAWAEEKTSTLSFTEKCNGTGTADDGAVWTITSDADESVFDNERGIHYGTNGANVTYIQLTTSDIPGTISKIVVEASGNNTPSLSVTVGDEAFGETITGITTSNASYTFNGSASGTIVVRLAKASAAKKALYVKSVTVTYEDGPASSAVATTTTIDASGIYNTDVYTSTEAGILVATVKAGDTEIGGTIFTWKSSDESVATVANGVVTLVAAGTTTISASYAGVEDVYKPSTGYYELTVTNNDPTIPGSQNNPYTVAQARAAIDAGTGITGVYATGIVSEIVTPYNESFGNISYNISADGLTTSDQLQAYRGKSYEGANFTSEDDIQVGDVVVIFGNLKKYNSTYEFDAGNQLVSLNRPAAKADPELSYEQDEYIVNITEIGSFVAPTLTNPHSLTVTYSSNKDDVASVNENTGSVVLHAVEGSATITATFVGDDDYKAGSASYKITIKDPDKAEKGTAENPYTVAEVIDGTATGTDIYVTGYIVGEYVGKTTAPRTSSFTGNSNLAIADEFTTSPTATESIPVQLPSNSTLQTDWGLKNNNGASLGYQVLLKGNAETYFTVNGIKNTTEITAVSVPATITDAGWATWVAPFNVEVPYEVTAYIVTAVDSKATLFDLAGIPANTPVFLKGAEGTHRFAVCEEGDVDDVSDNKLMISDGNAKDNIYVLYNGNSGVGLYKWYGEALAEGKVYLPGPTTGAPDFIGFGSETTGVNEVRSQMEANGEVYNLAGQRVAQPTKGLYIMNGKKVVIK